MEHSPPTQFLPRFNNNNNNLSTLTCGTIECALDQLRSLYFSPLLSSNLPPGLEIPKRHFEKPPMPEDDNVIPDSGYASAEDDDEDDHSDGDGHTREAVSESDGESESDALDCLRSDPFERAFAVKWTTSFVSRSETWVDSFISKDDKQARQELADDAASLLSRLLHDPQEGDERQEVALTRSFSFPVADTFLTKAARQPVQVVLNDEPLQSTDHTSVGLQSWASSILLTTKICADPASFALGLDASQARPLRVLELGAGTGLVSIALAKLLDGHHHPPTIIATDYHPDVLTNLRMNIAVNFPSLGLPQEEERVHVHTGFLDWENPRVRGTSLEEKFDVVVAADVVYHPEHAGWIMNCVREVLKKPSAECAQGGVFWLMIALRIGGRHEGLEDTVDEALPSYVGRGLPGNFEAGRECELGILESEKMERRGSAGRADEGGYRLFKIGWV